MYKAPAPRPGGTWREPEPTSEATDGTRRELELTSNVAVKFFGVRHKLRVSERPNAWTQGSQEWQLARDSSNSAPKTVTDGTRRELEPTSKVAGQNAVLGVTRYSSARVQKPMTRNNALCIK